MSRRNNTRGANLSNDQNADAEDNITLHEIAQQGNPMMNLVTRLLQQQNRLLEEMNRGGNAGNGGTLVTLERFKKLGPPVFKGTIDPLTAEAWLKHIEKVFTAISCPNEHDAAALAVEYMESISGTTTQLCWGKEASD
ncbi:hypothetical protein Q3G72_020106 [Acer saccharum]|nr:hypothetical protein Q3G72_020106 [Acer saccharum]